MQILKKTCRDCDLAFQIDEKDQSFYERIAVPHPSLCPDCRQRRRMSWRNERNLYHRKCDLCHQQIISMYHSDSPYTIYCNSCWWSDAWEPLDYGQEIDFNRSFFEQFHELQLKVPRLALYQKNSENSSFTNHTENLKDCYLCVDTADSQDVYYSKWVIHSKDCSDCYNIENAELSYETQYQEPAFYMFYSMYSNGSRDSAFLYNCLNCSHCFMSSNLVRKEYCIRNQEVGKEAYEAYMDTIDLGSHAQVEALKAEFKQLISDAPKRAGYLFSCEESSGDALDRCKNVHDSFDVVYSQDARYCYESGHLKDSYDVYESAFDCELQYECHGCNRGKFLKFSHVSYDVYDSDYLDSCHNSHNLFGCVGLRRKEHAILNRIYSAEEYATLKQQLISHMQKTGEWGEFFPMQLSPFAYNESIAGESYPLNQEEILARGLSWREEDSTSSYEGPTVELPDRLQDTPDSITQSILRCHPSGKLYKIIPQELALFRNLGVALPRLCPQERYKNRAALRPARRLWEWDCIACGKKVRAPYAPGSEASVYCQKCFNQKIYG